MGNLVSIRLRIIAAAWMGSVVLVQHGAHGLQGLLMLAGRLLELDGLALDAQVHSRRLSRSLLVSLDYTVVAMGEFVEARLLPSPAFSCSLMPFVKNRPIGKRVPMGRFWHQA